jgi:hypothetical protein
MTYRFVWAEGALRLMAGISKASPRAILSSMVDDGTINRKPQNIASGVYSDDDSLTLLWSRGEHPTEAELKGMIQVDLDRFGREAAARHRVARLVESVNTEDTEPTGGEGFLRDPHKNLYPYLFPDGGTEMPQKVRHLLKAHVLNQLDEAFEDADNFIYFTVYGSGISYNWDEGGDLDIQMWIDIEKFQQLNEDKATWTMDDLLAEVRRNVQMVNFPTVKDIGLQAGNSDEEVTGEMLVQYYPKPGKGTKEENLASQPYACLDLETGEWIVKAKPFDPQFYGLHFLEVMPKATDMAIQAEALLDEYERNVLNWQFWFSLYSRYRNPAYQQQYQEAQRNAIMEKAGIKTMFEGVFGGRAEAYQPGGKGIEDERDMTQKLLEVWGIFQRLKHYARAPLPWDETELPKVPSEPSGEGDADKQSRDTTDDTEDFVVSHKWILAHSSGWIKSSRLFGLPASAVGTNDHISQISNEYMAQAGLPYNPPREFATVDPTRAKRIADEYDRMEHAPNDPQVKASYDALIRETLAQYTALVNAGYTFEFYPRDHDPYPNSPHEAVVDLHNNKHLYVFPTQEGFGSGDADDSYHPLLRDSGIRWNGQPVSYNDLFRAVHDVFGHAKEGVGFRANGEENAWRQHSAMYSDLARKALTSETRGQNSWVNFGPYGEQNQNANQADTVYADQKAGLLPDWVTYEGDHDHNWRSSKWSMAERSGDPTLDKLIAEFSAQDFGSLPDINFQGMCDYVSEMFVSWLNKRGVEADYVSMSSTPERDADPPLHSFDELGYSDRGPGYSGHTVVKATMPSGTYLIDFTAAQYGYKEFPMIQKLDDGNWQREWTSSRWRLGGQYDSPEHRDPGGWAGIMQKAQRLREQGSVQVLRNGVQNIVGQIQGDHGTYQTEIWRQDPGKNTISLWNCECPWGGYSWGRTRQFKKYEGRPCAHALALYWQAQTQPLDEEYDQNQQLTIPGLDPYAGQPQPTPNPIDLNQALQQTVQPTPTMPTPVMPQSQPLQTPQKPKPPDQMEITFPGALSKWRKSSALENGDYARLNKAMVGFDDRGTQYTVPRNSIVEIVWSDETETIAIYSLNTGPLGAHNARIVGETSAFSWVPRTRGTAPRRQR